MMRIGEAPIAVAASMTPLSTSLREDSTSLAINGADPMMSGMTVAVEPSVVPVIARVIGVTAISSIRKGTERSRLIMTFSVRLIHLQGAIPSFRVTASTIPRGSPNTYAIAVEARVM
jgi:hypothetical protein